ncbi:MAG: N-acetylglucosamine-6-phosphate deacetylase [Burkholderiales bacterium]|nr:N-acetylglucosamine-6-phosphate deacetylase [Burkholderiales bacterium]
MIRDMRVITGKYVFDGINLLTDKAVLVADGLIVDIVDINKVFDKKQIEDFGNVVISSGMLDLQLNGCGGVLFNDSISVETLETMHQTSLRYGTTGFLPTLITSKFDDVHQALEVTKEWFKQFGNTRGVIGLHLEGPFLSSDKSGIHPKEFIVVPDDKILKLIASYAKCYPIKMTIAPENFTAEQISFLAKSGIIVSIGHSNASYEEAQKAFDNGAITATHLFNAMSGLTGRNPGVIGAILSNPCYTGIIVDLLHVDKHNVSLVSKLKPMHTYLVTDAVTPTGTDMTEFDFAGKHLYVRDGKCIDDTGTLGGAYLTMNEAVQNCVKECNISLEQALAMATIIPAQMMDLDNEIGRISIGNVANLIAIDLDDFSCELI